MARPIIVKKKVGNNEYHRKTINYRDECGVKRRKDLYADTKKILDTKVKNFWNELKQLEIEAAAVNDKKVNEKNTLKEQLEYWQTSIKIGEVEKNTYDGYRFIAKKWIYPSLGEFKLNEIRPVDVQKLLNHMTQEGKSFSTKKQMMIILDDFFTYAVNNKIAAENPTIQVKKPKVPFPEPCPFEQGEIKVILEHANANCEYQNYLFFFIAAYTGMRASEIAGMSVEKIDFNNEVILVHRKVVGHYEDDERTCTAKNYLKSRRSKRPVSMHPDLIAKLKDHIANQTLITNEDGYTYIFQDGKGNYFNPAKFCSSFKKLINTLIDKKLITTNKGVHNLRHSRATYLHEQGISIEVIARELGDLVTTVEKYYIKSTTNSTKNSGLGKIEVGF